MEVRDSSPLAAFSHRIGYARVSSVGQNLDSQLDVLQNAGCGKIFSDKMTGSRMDRPGWDQLLAYVRMGDTLVVTELSRMTRSLLDLLETAKVLSRRKVNLVSLRENIDTTTATGRCFLSMMGAIHQMERELRAERAAAGRTSARATRENGRKAQNGCLETRKCQNSVRELRQNCRRGVRNCRSRTTDILRALGCKTKIAA